MCTKYEPDIIVNALLAQFVAENILQTPFFVLGHIEGGHFATEMTRKYEQYLKGEVILAIPYLGERADRLTAHPVKQLMTQVLRRGGTRRSSYSCRQNEYEGFERENS